MDMLPLNNDHRGAERALEYQKSLDNPVTKDSKVSDNPVTHDEAVYNVQDVPKELDIFTRSEEDFLPAGKGFDDLTPAELRLVRSQYRFSPFRPGIYQGITGISPMT